MARATLIYWNSDTDKERIEKWLKKLEEEGHAVDTVTQDYNPEHGEPVWYIP